jgi:hypothetical protein
MIITLSYYQLYRTDSIRRRAVEFDGEHIPLAPSARGSMVGPPPRQRLCYRMTAVPHKQTCESLPNASALFSKPDRQEP